MSLTARDYLETCAGRLEAEGQQLTQAGLDAPVMVTQGRLVQSIGGLHLYEFTLPSGRSLAIDLPVSIIPGEEIEATEGVVISCHDGIARVQAVDAIGSSVPSATLIPDRAGHLQTVAKRLLEMMTKADAYNLGPAERLVPLLPGRGGQPAAGPASTRLLRP